MSHELFNNNSRAALHRADHVARHGGSFVKGVRGWEWKKDAAPKAAAPKAAAPKAAAPKKATKKAKGD